MTSWSVAAPAEAPRVRPRPRPAPTSRRPAPKRHVAGGVVWITVVALLLTGVVALNVAVLQLNMRFEELGRERADLQAENAALASQLSSSTVLARIQALAKARLGLVPADPNETSYIDLRH